MERFRFRFRFGAVGWWCGGDGGVREYMWGEIPTGRRREEKEQGEEEKVGLPTRRKGPVQRGGVQNGGTGVRRPSISPFKKAHRGKKNSRNGYLCRPSTIRSRRLSLFLGSLPSLLTNRDKGAPEECVVANSFLPCEGCDGGGFFFFSQPLVNHAVMLDAYIQHEISGWWPNPSISAQACSPRK